MTKLRNRIARTIVPILLALFTLAFFAFSAMADCNKCKQEGETCSGTGECAGSLRCDRSPNCYLGCELTCVDRMKPRSGSVVLQSNRPAATGNDRIYRAQRNTN